MTRERRDSGQSTPRWRRLARRALTELAGLAVALLVVASARSSLADHVHVPTGSMQPTVHVGDRLVVDKRAYGVRLPLTQAWLTEGDAPAPGDVVVLESPVDGTTLLKRVVAGPGDVVAVVGGRIVLDGRVLPVRQGPSGLVEELGGRHHPVRLTRGGGPGFGPVRIPEGRYLVMGDNRGDSLDGRSFGLVAREAILGRAVAIFARDGKPTWIVP